MRGGKAAGRVEAAAVLSGLQRLDSLHHERGARRIHQVDGAGLGRGEAESGDGHAMQERRQIELGCEGVGDALQHDEGAHLLFQLYIACLQTLVVTPKLREVGRSIE